MSELLHAEILADRVGPYCLFVHGFLSSRAQWHLNVQALAQVCRPVVIELWGHGRSPVPHDPACYTIDAYMRQFEALRERLGAADWFVCGQSMGACLALQYAAHHPSIVRGTIFTNSMAAFVPATQLRPEGAGALIEALEAGGLQARRALASLPMHARHARRLPPEIQRRLLEDAELLDPAAIALTIRHLTPMLSLQERLHQLHGPLLLVNGRFEAKFQPSRDLAVRRLPQLEVADLPAGHSVNAECAVAFNERVAGFLQSCAANHE